MDAPQTWRGVEAKVLRAGRRSSDTRGRPGASRASFASKVPDGDGEDRCTCLAAGPEKQARGGGRSQRAIGALSSHLPGGLGRFELPAKNVFDSSLLRLT
jgi:hypothetical protein